MSQIAPGMPGFGQAYRRYGSRSVLIALTSRLNLMPRPTPRMPAPSTAQLAAFAPRCLSCGPSDAGAELVASGGAVADDGGSSGAGGGADFVRDASTSTVS